MTRPESEREQHGDPVSAVEGEIERIRAEYERRGRQVPADFYALHRPGILFAYQQRVRTVLTALGRTGQIPLGTRRVLDVGCGRGDWLADFVAWGASADRLAGIELDEARTAEANARIPQADIRCGDASQLPWPSAQFDVVVQSTLFSSVRSEPMAQAIAGEMVRVLRPGGCVIWYDMAYGNPWNPAVRGYSPRQIRALFPRLRGRILRLTLAPPLARRLAPISWMGALALEKLKLFNTHLLAVLETP